MRDTLPAPSPLAVVMEKAAPQQRRRSVDVFCAMGRGKSDLGGSAMQGRAGATSSQRRAIAVLLLLPPPFVVLQGGGSLWLRAHAHSHRAPADA